MNLSAAFCILVKTIPSGWKGKRSGSGCFSWWYPLLGGTNTRNDWKAKQMTSWIIRNVVSRKQEVLIPFYKAFVGPHLEYAVQVWAPTARHGNWGIIMAIEDYQRQFTRIIEGMGLLSSSNFFGGGAAMRSERRRRKGNSSLPHFSWGLNAAHFCHLVWNHLITQSWGVV